MFQCMYFDRADSTCIAIVAMPYDVDKTGTVGFNPIRGMYVRSTPAVFPSLCYPRTRRFTKQLQQDSQTQKQGGCGLLWPEKP